MKQINKNMHIKNGNTSNNININELEALKEKIIFLENKIEN